MIALTFDNLGEAAEVQLGGEQTGEHFSVTEVLPKLLDALGEHGLTATFFVEGLNAELYPNALARIADGGHEVAYHAWCHEEWGELGAGEQADNLERGMEALHRLGLRPAGFRPPGGALDEAGERALAQVGFRYASPEGEAPSAGEVVRLPFRWPLVDAYWVLPTFAERREANGHEEGIEGFVTEVERALGDDDYVPLIMHPFLWADPANEEAARGVLERLAGREVLRMAEAAEQLR
jgi:peptidoglycan/xylan/chitin deacetylase (PgdA/CDA1 family)